MGASGSGDGVCFWRPAMVSEPTPEQASSPHYSVGLATRPPPTALIEWPLTSTGTSESTMFCRRLRRLAAMHRYCLSGMGRDLEFGSPPASRSSEDWRSNVERWNLGCVRGVAPVLGLFACTPPAGERPLHLETRKGEFCNEKSDFRHDVFTSIPLHELGARHCSARPAGFNFRYCDRSIWRWWNGQSDHVSGRRPSELRVEGRSHRRCCRWCSCWCRFGLLETSQSGQAARLRGW